MQGQFVWYELTTPDPDAAKRFYPSLTSWGTQQFDKDYTMWTQGGQPFAGIFRLSPEMRQKGVPPNWMPYIEANNVDDTLRQATSAGGRVIVPAADIPNVGRYAVLADPQGATFGLYKSLHGSQGWDGTPALGRFSWHELMTTDHKGAFEFFRKLFGWEKQQAMEMGPEMGGTYQMYGMKGKMFGGMYNRPPRMANVPPFWLCYAHVPDVKKGADVATRAGGKIVNGPMEVPGGDWIVVLSDPQGAAIALHQAARKPATMPASTGTTGGAKKSARKAAKRSPAR